MEDVSLSVTIMIQSAHAGDDEGFLDEDYSITFVRALLRVQNNIVTMPNSKEHFDLYLADAVYPTLVPALEGLAREIDRLTTSEGIHLY